jgi:hypothetical protein
MNTKIRVALAAAACAAACAIGFGQTPGVDSQIPGPAPAQGYVWMSGHWVSEGGQWKWVAAHWDLPPSQSATWVGGHWVSPAGKWVWVNGAWNVSDAPMAQAGPPQPPGTYPQGVPAPATPAPYVDGQYEGQYGPGAVARAIDQPPVTTDYGPVDASAPGYPVYDYPGYAYPDYGWVGDPWFWGFPGVALGFGFGPGFHGGYYRGGYNHGGYYRGGGGYYRGAHGSFSRPSGGGARGFAGHSRR